MNITIAGAGLSGLIAANLMKHRFTIEVHEKAKEVPNNKPAVLRFRSDVLANALDIPFRKVRVIKDVAEHGNAVKNAMIYSRRTTGTLRSDRSVPLGPEVVDRYIAPLDMVKRLSEDINIVTGSDAFGARTGGPIISTVPMPVLITKFQAELPWRDVPEFAYTKGYVLSFRVKDCDAFASLYCPQDMDVSRISITGDEVTAEYPWSNSIYDLTVDSAATLQRAAAEVCANLGISSLRIQKDTVVIKPQQYAKIQPIDDRFRKNFIAWLTDKKNIYSLGRFATWRPTLLLDDLVNDVRMITKFITGNNYDTRKER